MTHHAQLTARDIHGPYAQLLTNLVGNNGEEWLLALNRFLRKENPWEKPKLLRRIGTTAMPARTVSFVARNYFKVNLCKNDKVKISLVGDSFFEYFLAGEGKLEVASGLHELAYYQLVKRSPDMPIVTELGGEILAECMLADVWAKIEAQGDGRNGDLLTNGCANIFYVRDTAGELRMVDVGWDDDGWQVSTHPVSNPDAWTPGHRVFTSNSVPSSS